MIVFDVDGVLVDSEELVRTCYRDAGVIMPDDAWGRPWHTWLTDSTAHEVKNKLYLQAIDDGLLPLLDGAALACELVRDKQRVGFATGSSWRAFVAVFKATGLHAAALSSCATVHWQVDCTTSDKVKTLYDWGAKVYVDDLEVGRTIADDVGCGFVHYAPGHIDETRTEVLKWT